MGRIVFTSNYRIDIEPIHYGYRFGWLYGRPSKGAKLEAITHQPQVAFEVDEMEGVFDWRSVVVRDSVQLLNPVAMPWIGPDDMPAPEDPAPHRYITFPIHVDDVSGYSARPAPVA